MPAPERVKRLVETFEQNINEYRSRKNETELRRQFLDPFFEALGWDVDNKKGYDERNKEVAHEYSVEIEGQQKKADYAFRTPLKNAGQVGRASFDFLVEAKKPWVKIETSLDPAFQLRRYGWSARLPINILTDFEHFAVYDCRIRPNYSKDKVGTGLINIIHYKEYLERWDEIAGLFSPEAIREGALDKYKDKLKTKKGTQEVDEAFLEEIEAWRETLARNIATRNKHLNLNEAQVNFAVQMTIDRIIFLRIAEERGMEKDRRLFEICEYDGIYNKLLELFQQADARYNSGLFHFKKDRERENPDTLTPSLDVDDKVLKDIIKDLYYPSPYAFNYIPTEILGSVYERFLGKVIRLTAGGNAKVEDKPEVRKAGGVYYTPAYIVDYIVKNTVGKLLENKTPDDIAKVKIVDPACGSGSFLLGAYQYLLDWHLDWYTSNNSEKHVKNKTLLTADNKTYRLSIDEKKRILLNNIHGVDLDPQAVEVTKLSLLLKVVEDPGQLKMFEEGHILPNLNKNIKNGNALIGTDYFSGQMFGDMEEMKRVNPFDWKSEFPQVFKQGGFDVVIGNPPYVRPHNIPEDTKKMLWKIYATFVAKSDMYSCFMERGTTITKNGGSFSFIVLQTWTSLESFTKIRELLIQNTKITKLVQLPKKVFQDATVETCIFVVQKDLQNNSGNLITVERLTPSGKEIFEREYLQSDIEQAYLYNFQLYGKNEGQSILAKVQETGKSLSDFVSLSYGFKTGDDEKFINSEKSYPESQLFIRSADVGRYSAKKPREYVWYIPEKMTQNRKTARPGDKERFEAEKIVVARMGKTLGATYDSGGLYVKDAMLLLNKDKVVSLKYLLGIINSQLLTYYYQKFFITIEHALI